MRKPIYLDNAATTPVDPRVVDAMLPYLREHFGNPASSTHLFGGAARQAVEQARADVAALLNAAPHEIVWTSGATESNNLALKGIAGRHCARGRHLVTLSTEHKAVLDTMHELERRGFSVTFVPPEKTGLVDPERFAAALQPDTIAASVMLVNNEIGVIQDVAMLGELCRSRGILFHVDAAQATGKVAIDLKALPIDLMSLTAHKTYGPKGIGALYVRDGIGIEAQMHGGGHERGMRSGTLPTHQIVGMGTAYRLAREEMAAELPRMGTLRDRLWGALRDLPGLSINGDMHRRVPHNLNVSLALPGSDTLLASLGDIAISSTAACDSGSVSHVMLALHGEAARDATVLRISVGRFNTAEEIDHAAAHLRTRIAACRDK